MKMLQNAVYYFGYLEGFPSSLPSWAFSTGRTHGSLCFSVDNPDLKVDNLWASINGPEEIKSRPNIVEILERGTTCRTWLMASRQTT